MTRTRYAIVGGGIIGVERQRLTDIDDRSRRNGVPGIRRLDTAELREIEPHVRGVAGLHLERGLVYPMPDPRYPFLGVHLTLRVDGQVMVGPNAVLALSREGYRWSDVSAADLRDLLAWKGFRRFAPSPAATSSLAIAEHLVDLVLDRQGAA